MLITMNEVAETLIHYFIVVSTFWHFAPVGGGVDFIRIFNTIEYIIFVRGRDDSVAKIIYGTLQCQAHSCK